MWSISITKSSANLLTLLSCRIDTYTILSFIIPDFRQFAHGFFRFWQKVQIKVLLLCLFTKSSAAFSALRQIRQKKRGTAYMDALLCIRIYAMRPQAGLPDNASLLDVVDGGELADGGLGSVVGVVVHSDLAALDLVLDGPRTRPW
ncbi:MAG: hypothetical protein ACLS34_02345 [Faecalibacterium sp.]